MKPIFFAILIFSTIAFGCVNYKVKSLCASVRDGPSKSAKLKGVRLIGQKLCIEEITNDYAKINSGLYIKTDSIKPVDKAQTAPLAKPANVVTPVTPKTSTPSTPSCKTMYVNITSGTLNMRTGPGTTFAASGTLAKGAAVCVVSTANGWSKLDNGKYVSATLITATKPGTQTTPTTPTTSSGGSTGASSDSSWNCKYFTFKELIHSDTAKGKGIDNEPKNPEHIANLKLLCEKILDPLRVKWGGPITVNSGFRSQALNDVLPGASKTSQHMTGQAADLHTSDNKRLFEMIKTSDLPYDQLINEYNYSWIHVSYGPENRRQVLAIP